MSPQITKLVTEAIADKVFPGCSIAVIDGEDITLAAYGAHTYEHNSTPVTIDTLYDCASITKVIGPMSLAMMLVDDGVFDLDTKVGEILPEFVTEPQKALVTLRHLLTYTLDFDMPDGAKSLLTTRSPESVAAEAISHPLKYAPGTNYRYSNITAFLLTQCIERATGKSFYDLVQRRILEPLHMATSTFAPTVEERAKIPPTELTSERGVVQGVVHDEFTHYMSEAGISCGAAGLFAPVTDLTHFLYMTLARGIYDEQKLFSPTTVSAWTTDQFPALLPTLTPLGWGDRNNHYINRYHREIVVKSGFTGCYMVADLQQKRGFALLSNRTYPERPADASAFEKIKAGLMEEVIE
jgi:CubicO group peptidase (beta-lactamase class C family)